MRESYTQHLILQAIHSTLEAYSEESSKRTELIDGEMLRYLTSSAVLFRLLEELRTTGTPPEHNLAMFEASTQKMVRQLRRLALLSCGMILQGVAPLSLSRSEQSLSRLLIQELQERSLFSADYYEGLVQNGLLPLVGLSSLPSTPHISSADLSKS